MVISVFAMRIIIWRMIVVTESAYVFIYLSVINIVSQLNFASVTSMRLEILSLAVSKSEIQVPLIYVKETSSVNSRSTLSGIHTVTLKCVG